MKILDEALGLSIPRGKKKTYHFSYIFKRNTLLAIGENDPNEPSPKVERMGRLFGVRKFIEYPYHHSETHALSKLLGRYNLNGTTMVNVRVSRDVRLSNSKPCPACEAILSNFHIRVFYTTKNGFEEC